MAGLGQTKWQGYLHAIGLGGRIEATYARMLERIGGANPSQTLTAIERRAADGRIGVDGYGIHIEAFERLRDMWQRGTQTHIAEHARGDWIDMGDGARMRAVHRDSAAGL